MGKLYQSLGLSLLLLSANSLAKEFSENLDISGFGRLIVGQTSDDNIELAGYSNELSLSPESLFAVQVDFKISESLSLASQALLHSSDRRDSGIEWLYLKVEPDNLWQFKAGMLRTPFALYSDVVDVGFAYPWLSTPTPVYGTYFFSNYTGASLSFNNNFDQYTFDIESYWGQYDGEVFSQQGNVDATVDNLYGIIGNIRKDNFNVRFSHHIAEDIEVIVPPISQLSDAIRQAGFPSTAKNLDLDDSAKFYQVGFQYFDLDYFFAGEWSRFSSNLLLVSDEIDSYYLTLGKYISAYQVHFTFGETSTKDIEANDSGIPIGIDPSLDALDFGYRSIFDQLAKDNLKYYSIGARYDLSPSIALKAQLSYFEPDEKSIFVQVRPGSKFDGKAFVYQAGVEWVF